MGAAVAACHGDHGVEVRCGVSIASVEADGVTLADGTRERADVVVVGIGVAPCTAWLDGSGLEVRDGVVCDATLATTAPGVFAAGDVVRIEHWTNAAEQGALAASNLLAWSRGEPGASYAPVPFFWSDQYDRRVQFVGRAARDDEVRVVAGSVEDRQLVALYGRDGLLHGALGLNSPRLVMPYRALLARRASWDEALAHAAG
jgi:hypothetical protein